MSRSRNTLALFSVVSMVGIAGTGCAFAEEMVNLQSPDKRIAVEVTDTGGQANYSVTFNGAEVVSQSRLGLRFVEGPNLDEGLAITGIEKSKKNERWEQPWGESRFVRDRHNEVLVHFESTGPGNPNVDVRFRAFNDGVAFRYEVPDTGERAIIDEITEFMVNADATAWWTPATSYNRYEYIYRTTPVRQMERAHTPFTVKLPDGNHLAIHEAALVNYGGMYLDQRRDGKLEVEIAPRHDGVKVRTDGAFVTPWRVVQISEDAPGLINGSDIYLNLNEPNALGDVSYVEPGVYAGIWWGMHINTMTWGSSPIHGATTENTKRYIDFAAANNMVGVLVEGWNIGWDGDWFNNGELFRFAETYPDFDIEEVSHYAEEKGVRLIGHHETSGNITNYENQMEEAFALYEANGVRTVKTGYVADASDLKMTDEDGNNHYTWHYAQEAVDHHLRVLKAAHEHSIAINAHEPVKDTGLRRTYPNAISREGARGQEFNAWGTPPNPVEHSAILTYTRMLSGPMDFTPGIFDLMPNGPDNINRVQTTLAHQLALYIVLYSPIQMAADLPENYEANPEPLEFIRNVATDWEESIALQGEVGDYTVIARQERDGEEWFLGAVTDENARTLSVPLDFLPKRKSFRAEIYRDGPEADWKSNPYDIVIEDKTVRSSDTLELPLGSGGGAAVRFVPVN